MMKQYIFSLLLTVSILLFALNLEAQDQQQIENLRKLSETYELQFRINKAEALQIAGSLGLPVRQEDAEGRIIELMRFENGIPVYYTTLNAGGATTINSDKVYPGGTAGLNLTGSGQTLGIWDGGRVRLTHQELNGRVVQVDGATSNSNHATHVGGTMIASGVSSLARGMSYQANLDAYDWNNDASEMAAAAAGGLRVSQHSYGFITGWRYDFFNDNRWVWFGNTSVSETEDYFFGFYDNVAQQWDQIALNASNYLIVKSAGNDRGYGPVSQPVSHWVYQGDEWVLSTQVRQLDGGSNGYDCISRNGTAKNILTVGAVTATGVMSSFSSWGPTDDGRVKPDIVAKGVSVYSSIAGNDAQYSTYNGTSMSGPMVSGSVGLLLQHQENLNPGNALLSSTMKALILHSANDAISGAPGPDYRFGWGMMDTEKAAEIMSNNASESGIHIYELTLINGEEIIIPVRATGNEPLRATIVWADPPGTPPPASLNPTTLMLVNDLDLRIQDSNSNEFFPYILDPSNPATAATTGDNFRDNVEMVHIAFPVAEEIYQVKISHKGGLSGGSQQFSLIITGNQDISSVANPQSLTAVSSGSHQIDLTWTGNSDNHDVMVVWSLNYTFGIPENGTVYLAGESIPGGGTVLYRGADNSFEHAGLEPATSYYYKAFSFDPLNEYSSGITANTTTDCADIFILPYSENFDASANLPVCWEILDHEGNGQVWQVGTITGYDTSNPDLSNYYAYLNSDIYGSGSTQNTDLVTPTLDLSNYTDVSLSFSHFFRQYFDVSTATLSYSINDGETWIALQTWIATTTNPASFSQVISAVAGQQQVRFKWNYSGTWGYYWAVDDIEITGTPLATFWLGSVDNDWNNPANWSDGIPDSNLDPVIQPATNFPQIENNLTIENIHINAGATLIIIPQGQLSVNGNITGDGNLLIQSDATGTGSLLHSSPDVHAIVERFVSGPENSWHQLSVPVQNQAINGESPGDFDEGSFFTWHEPAQTWVMFSTTVTSFVWPSWLDANDNQHDFIPARGYLAAYPYASGNQQTKEFQGLLNVGTQSFVLSHQSHPDDLYHGFNLAGNPYPSSIDWKASEGWNRSALFEINQDENDGFSYWIWNPEWGQYGTYSSGQTGDLGTAETSRYIAPMQGFWILAAENGVLEMDNRTRVHSDQDWLKKLKTQPGALRLIVSSEENSYRDEVILEFRHKNRSGGSKKMLSMIAEAPSLYTLLNNDAYSISFHGNPQTYESIPLGFKPGIGAQYVISAIGLDDFDIVLLEDLKKGILHPLNQQKFYTFQASIHDEPERFMLHFNPLGIEETNHLQPYAFYNQGKLVISGFIQEPSVMQVFDAGGRLIREFKPGSGQMEFQFNDSPGLYFLRIISNIEVLTIKVVIPG